MPIMCSLFQVGDEGEIGRLRRECTECGKGSFMAEHKDRFYCGKCHFTEAKTGKKNKKVAA